MTLLEKGQITSGEHTESPTILDPISRIYEWYEKEYPNTAAVTATFSPAEQGLVIQTLRYKQFSDYLESVHFRMLGKTMEDIDYGKRNIAVGRFTEAYSYVYIKDQIDSDRNQKLFSPVETKGIFRYSGSIKNPPQRTNEEGISDGIQVEITDSNLIISATYEYTAQKDTIEEVLRPDKRNKRKSKQLERNARATVITKLLVEIPDDKKTKIATYISKLIGLESGRTILFDETNHESILVVPGLEEDKTIDTPAIPGTTVIFLPFTRTQILALTNAILLDTIAKPTKKHREVERIEHEQQDTLDKVLRRLLLEEAKGAKETADLLGVHVVFVNTWANRFHIPRLRQ